MTKNGKEEKIIFKIITIGEKDVGKTSIIRRYINNNFSEEKIDILGINVSEKKIQLKNGEKVYIKLIDTLGQEQYRSLHKQYVKNIDGVLFVFDLSRIETFKSIKIWMEFFNDNYKGRDNIPKYLIGNKKDLEKEVEQDRIDFFLNDNEKFFCKYKETSAKKEDNEINELFQEMSEILYKDYKKYMTKKKKNIKVLSQKDIDKRNCVLGNCVL